jgi:hypothetical protein
MRRKQPPLFNGRHFDAAIISHHFFQFPEAERKPQIPTDTEHGLSGISASITSQFGAGFSDTHLN